MHLEVDLNVDVLGNDRECMSFCLRVCVFSLALFLPACLTQLSVPPPTVLSLSASIPSIVHNSIH